MVWKTPIWLLVGVIVLAGCLAPSEATQESSPTPLALPTFTNTAAPASTTAAPTPAPEIAPTDTPSAESALTATPLPTSTPVQIAPADLEPLSFNVRLPPGFRIGLYASGLPNARFMARGPDGVLFVGTRTEGKVYAVLDRDGDYKAEQVITLASGMNSPNGVAYRDGALYVAEINRILRYDNIAEHLDALPEPVVVSDAYPSDGWHGWKVLRFGPDGKLYAPVGAPCNVCEIEGLYGSITRLNADGSGLEVYATGIRNSVGFDWQPQSGELWFTDNGVDHLGDDLPPDELNRAPTLGMNFGFPYCHGGTVADPEFGEQRNCIEFTPPVQKLGPHVAALGMRFYNGAMFPPEYQNQILIAEHGSSSRTERLGYRIMLVRLDEANNAISYDPFAEGWLEGEQVHGRPVDLLVLPDGSLLVSDDDAGVIYRIIYEPA
ncbi:MAG: PQQ-dependent sugar dehydrogenase [Caldilineaceae bacterium]